MSKKENLNYNQYGLIGKNISYSFSPDYFTKKFKQLNIQSKYDIFDLEKIEDIQKIFQIENLAGLNVTIPYKQQIIPFLDELSMAAQSIGAVNTIQFKENKIIGHNTDYIGFLNSIKPLLKSNHQKALILGSGGANKAVQFALAELNIPFTIVSRHKNKGDLIYSDLNQEILNNHQIIINTTPVGTYPNIDEMPLVPIEFIQSYHLVYDLIYNPLETKLLKKAKIQGAVIKNGLEMLKLQADVAWSIWNES